MKRIAVVVALVLFAAVTLYTTNGCGGVYSGEAMRVPQPEPEVEIDGRVRDGATGAPLPTAEVTVVQGNGKFVHNVSSAGTFAVAGLVRGEVRVTVSAPGYRTITNTFPVRKGKNRYDAALFREP